jgi:hypothetical protein
MRAAAFLDPRLRGGDKAPSGRSSFFENSIRTNERKSGGLPVVSRASPDRVGGRLCTRFEGETPSTRGGLARIGGPAGSLLDRDAFGKIAGLVDVVAAEHGGVIRQ